MLLKAVLFDLDNTLMDRDNTFLSFTWQLVRECLVPMEKDDADKLVAEIIVRDADGYREKEGFFLELIDILPWQQKPSLEELQRYYNQYYMTHAKVMDHAIDTLQACRNMGLRLGIITNGHSQLQHRKIDLLHLPDYFDEIVISGEVGLSKPDPQIYRLALERLGVGSNQCIIVGDHPRNDIWGAAQVGIQGIWLRRKHEWDEKLTMGKPWRTIMELDEVPGLLPQFEAGGVKKS
ncbi:HAD family hydrolase [Paenibacillus sanguinis]|uniref:HAD family hydrolase n=1 Tax=Paenibacillus sanguinis TaxID=225906 RepID=UPI000368FAEF|nr:HAD family hydrolase [Paenibacillus sanguinis]